MNEDLIQRTRDLIAAKTAELDTLTELLHHLTGDTSGEFDGPCPTCGCERCDDGSCAGCGWLPPGYPVPVGTVEHIDGHEIREPEELAGEYVTDADRMDSWKPGDGPHPTGKWYTTNEDADGNIELPHKFCLFYDSGRYYGMYDKTREGLVEAWNDARDYGCDIDFRHTQQDLNRLLEEVTAQLCEGSMYYPRGDEPSGTCRKILREVPDGHTLCRDCRG